MQLATDADLCAMFAITPETLAKHRGLIDKARAGAITTVRYRRVKAQAQAVKRARPASGAANGSELSNLITD